MCRQVGAALDAAHAQGLIHRDVKPANVLIAGRNVYLTDFGLTKRVGGTQVTAAGDVVGTIHYVAPEQIEGREVTARSDVYSLGCVLYHCLTGRMPYERDTDVAVIYAHLSEPPPRPSRVQPDLADGFDDVIARALDKNPERRYQTCAELMTAARAVVESAGPLAETLPPRRTGVPAPRSRRCATRAAARAARGRGRVDAGDRPRGAGRAGGRARGRQRDRTRRGPRRPPGPGDPGRGGDRERAARRPVTRDSKVLLVVDESAGRDPRAAGADERLSSPFSPLQLQVKLRKLLGADAIGA